MSTCKKVKRYLPHVLKIRDAFSIRSQKEVLRVIMSNILKLFCQGKSWESYKPFYPAKLTVLWYKTKAPGGDGGSSDKKRKGKEESKRKYERKKNKEISPDMA
ncbi:hypothetical protein DPMN_177145 [Dreissena polymorpha]|uniref:Uncharacterized protein n=1 Tax=Dreissena polymorpha TaxID=45954 RepID=A0A9D4EB81_DREPO|nr:hypothetical protein DPMN_177145 [Dreissena polymorpha]